MQSLMTLLGHVSAEMSLRYGRLFDSTVRTEYERALTAAKAHLGTLPADPPQGRAQLPIVDGDWKHAPAVKARLAGGFCIRAQVQGPCAYANICEHCPNFRTDTGYLPVLAAQRADTETLARDAEARGWTGKPNVTADSSNASMPTSVRLKPDDGRKTPPTRRKTLCRNHSQRATRHLRRGRRAHRTRASHPLPQPRIAHHHRGTPHPRQ
ncbi:hypothetical protein BST21_07460 [Mycolicibacterium celeriflavum]|nr:hypothetical protein BST21_07460 [Mycolicibacterium celeriflavum]